MHLDLWLSATSAAVFLTIGVLVSARGRDSALARPLSALSACLFLYHIIEIVRVFSDRPLWDSADAAVGAACGPPTLLLSARFMGQSRSLRIYLRSAYLYFGGIAALSLAPVLWPSLSWFPGGSWWALAMLLGIVAFFAPIGVLLVRHGQLAGPREASRTRLLGWSLAIGVGGVILDLVSLSGADTPRLSSFALAASAILLATLVLRTDLVEQRNTIDVISTLAVASFAILAHLTLLSIFRGQLWILLFGGLASSLASLVAIRPVLASMASERARTEQLAALGRFSAQMAHDLRNPLAAIKGAAQILVEERRRGALEGPYGELLELISEQADRLSRVVDKYQRLGRVEPVLELADPAAIVSEVVAAQRAATLGTSVEIHFDPPAIEPIRLDPDLFAGAIENVMKNAREAVVDGAGVIAVSVDETPGAVVVSVKDNGVGMDPRARERVFLEPFTTKTTGSGLGMVFVSRVVKAHQGKVLLTSAEGEGTTVRLVIPKLGPRTGE